MNTYLSHISGYNLASYFASQIAPALATGKKEALSVVSVPLQNLIPPCSQLLQVTGSHGFIL